MKLWTLAAPPQLALLRPLLTPSPCWRARGPPGAWPSSLVSINGGGGWCGPWKAGSMPSWPKKITEALRGHQLFCPAAPLALICGCAQGVGRHRHPGTPTRRPRRGHQMLGVWQNQAPFILAGGCYVIISQGGCQEATFLTMELSSSLNVSPCGEKDT